MPALKLVYTEEGIPTFKEEWLKELAKERAERDRPRASQEYARAIAAYYEKRVAEVTEHARKLGEQAILLQRQAEARAREQAKEADAALEQKFRRLADEWYKDTKHVSSVDEMVLHHNYLKVISMGQDAVPLLLRELEQRPDHWLVALNVITEQDPAKPEDNFHEAVQAWLAWGRREGYLR